MIGRSIMFKVRENQNGSRELIHYGVQGMKWGVRNAKKQNLNTSNKTKSSKSGILLKAKSQTNPKGGGSAEIDKSKELYNKFEEQLKNANLTLGDGQSVEVDLSNPKDPRYIFKDPSSKRPFSYKLDQLDTMIMMIKVLKNDRK